MNDHPDLERPSGCEFVEAGLQRGDAIVEGGSVERNDGDRDVLVVGGGLGGIGPRRAEGSPLADLRGGDAQGEGDGVEMFWGGSVGHPVTVHVAATSLPVTPGVVADPGRRGDGRPGQPGTVGVLTAGGSQPAAETAPMLDLGWRSAGGRRCEFLCVRHGLRMAAGRTVVRRQDGTIGGESVSGVGKHRPT